MEYPLGPFGFGGEGLASSAPAGRVAPFVAGLVVPAGGRVPLALLALVVLILVSLIGVGRSAQPHKRRHFTPAPGEQIGGHGAKS